MMKNRYLNKYATEGFNNVQGWAAFELFEIIDRLSGCGINNTGGVLEIGIHHGKFYLMLNQVTQKYDLSFAVDIFDNQHLNVDSSGKGSLENFIENLENYDAHGGSNTKIIHGDSTDRGLRLREKIGLGTMRYISVDGGHTVEHTINDLMLASDLIKADGVVILDDFLNRHWLGVTEGVIRFLMNKPTLVPFASGFNKLFLCNLSHYSFYFELMDSYDRKTKQTELIGRLLVSM